MFEFNIPTSKALVLLQRCLSLEDLTFSCTGKWWPLKVPPQSSIALPHMKSLSIWIEGENEKGQWLGAFSFPHLVQLEFVGNWDPVLAPVITSSECLKELRLCRPIPAADMDAILRRGRFLETLDLPSDSLSRSALEMLSHGEFVPVLRNLSCVVTEDDLDHDFDMLESRRLALCPDIEKVSWYLFTNDKSFGKEREDKLKSEGWDIRLYRYDYS
jgi:hypothetical protein